MRRIFYLLLFLVICLLTSFVNTKAVGVGQCHTSTSIGDTNVDWVYPSGEVLWANIEPEKCVFNFQPIDDLINTARRNNKKIWLQILTSNPDTPGQHPSIPQWAIDAGMRYVNRGVPITWDPLYLKFHGGTIEALARKYDSPAYDDVVEAVIIQGGGSYGEMTLNLTYCAGDAPVGTLPDVGDPNNIYIKEMARTKLGDEFRSAEIARQVDGRWVFDDYYIENVKKIIDIYAANFKRRPLVIQIGTGISCQGRVYQEAVEYAVSRLGSRFWVKNNSWGSFTGLNPASDYFMSSYRDRTKTIYEVGHPMYFCSKEYSAAHPENADGINNCYWGTQTEAIQHNTNAVNRAISDGISSICFHSNFFDYKEKYPLDLVRLKTGLSQNNNAILPMALNYNPTSEGVSCDNGSENECPRGSYGNLNCDPQGVINGSDLAILLRNWAPSGGLLPPLAGFYSADIVLDNKVNASDLAKLIRNWTF